MKYPQFIRNNRWNSSESFFFFIALIVFCSSFFKFLFSTWILWILEMRDADQKSIKNALLIRAGDWVSVFNKFAFVVFAFQCIHLSYFHFRRPFSIRRFNRRPTDRKSFHENTLLRIFFLIHCHQNPEWILRRAHWTHVTSLCFVASSFLSFSSSSSSSFVSFFRRSK